MENNLNYQSEANKTGLAIASMVLGILSMTLCCMGGWIPGLIGLIMAIISLAKGRGGKGMAIAGLITSILGTIVGIYFLVCMVIGVGSDEFQDAFWDAFQESYYEQTGEYYDFDN